MTPNEPQSRTMVRLPRKLHDAIVRLARSECRSFNSEVIYRLRKSVENSDARAVEDRA
jgi:hypothetical protein